MPGVEEERRERGAEHRTFLAQERTLLAWWRSGLAALAVALAVGRLFPALLDASHAPFAYLGIGFAILCLGFIVYGSIRDRIVNQGLRHGEFRAIDRGIVWMFTALLAVLAIVTIALSAENL
jgi:inner membrane protein YidH